MNRIEQFDHEGKIYQVRAMAGDDGYKVQTFSADAPVSPTYSVTFETGDDFVNSGWGDAVEKLIEWAKSDITSGRLKELAEALAAK